jgi:hypothetical protein
MVIENINAANAQQSAIGGPPISGMTPVGASGHHHHHLMHMVQQSPSVIQ